MIFSIRDRINIFDLFPVKGNIQDQMIVKDIAKKIEIAEKETHNIGLISKQQEDGKINYVWDLKKAKDKEIELSDSEVRFLKNQIDNLDKKNEVTQNILDLCLKIKDSK